ncbi:hypothetical protein BY458DRAFT_551676 [Sporodiniella umbellata]|nr:hypothetical protein BY458DRAFT_551676 [Sporodiniella umbellata]
MGFEIFWVWIYGRLGWSTKNVIVMVFKHENTQEFSFSDGAYGCVGSEKRFAIPICVQFLKEKVNKLLVFFYTKMQTCKNIKRQTCENPKKETCENNLKKETCENDLKKENLRKPPH